jgi:transcriptional regulator GlxA family with amidase domain
MDRLRPQVAPLTLAALLVLSLPAFTGCRPREPEGGTQAETTPAAPSPAPAPAPAPPPAGTGTTSDLGTSDLATSDLETATTPATDLPTDRPLRAAFLVVDGVYNSELMAPFDVLQHTKFHAQPGIEPFTVSPTGEPVTTFEGIRVSPSYGFQNAPPVDILVVPSAAGSMDKDLQNAALIDWVRRVGGQARNVISLCDGAFVLAQAGLLEGVPATTFPDDYKRFAQAFPKVDLRINVSFVDAGKVLTSQGGARSYDVAMHLVDRLYGPQVARGIGHGLLIPWPPPPGAVKYQTAVSAPPPAEATPARP